MGGGHPVQKIRVITFPPDYSPVVSKLHGACRLGFWIST